MFIRRNQKLNKYGFSLMESVLALAVISISSVGILSLVLSAQRATINAAQKQQAQLYAMDIINCYRVSNSTETFQQNMAWALDGDYEANLEFLEDKKTLTVTIVKDGKTLAEAEFTKGVPLTNEETP